MTEVSSQPGGTPQPAQWQQPMMQQEAETSVLLTVSEKLTQYEQKIGRWWYGLWLVWPMVVLGLHLWQWWPSWLQSVMWSAGWVMGIGVLLIDRLWLHRWYDEETPQQPEAVSTEAARAALRDSGQVFLTRSLLFLAVYIPLAIFVVTSTGSRIGQGVVLGLGWWLTREIVTYAQQPEVFNRVIGQSGADLSHFEIRWIVRGFVSIWWVLTVVAL